MKFRVTGILTAAAMTASFIPASAIVAYAEDGAFYASKDNYNFWYDNIGNEGEVKILPGINGNCECTWDSVKECQLNDGEILSGEHDISEFTIRQLEYDIELDAMDSTYFGYTGKIENADPELPDYEFWIVEGWTSWRPPGINGSIATLESDGYYYDIYKKSVFEIDESGRIKETIQLYSVLKSNPVQYGKKSKHKKSISFYKHLEAWKEAAPDLSGKLSRFSLSVHSYNASGSFTVNKNEMYFNSNLLWGRKEKENSKSIEQNDGYDFCISKNGDMGNAELESGENGTYNCTWKAADQCQFSSGLSDTPKVLWQDSGDIQLDYALDVKSDYDMYAGYSGILSDSSGNDKNSEFHIIEAWNGTFPLENTEKTGTYTANGNEYDMYVFLNENGTENYWGIRNEAEYKFDTLNELSGTVTLSEHLDVWKKEHPDFNDTVSEINLSVNANGGNGSAEIKKNDVIFGEPLKLKENGTEDKDAYRKLVGSEISVGHTVSPDEIGENADYYGERFDYFTPKDVLNINNLFDSDASIKTGSIDNPQVSLEKAAPILKYCEENNLPIFGGTFISGSTFARTFFTENYSMYGHSVSREILQQRLENLIKNTFEALKNEYPNLKICGYEVCSNLYNPYVPVLYGSKWSGEYDEWYSIYGNDDYIYDAYKFARKYSPEGTKLYYSENSNFYSLKTMDMYSFVTELQAKGLIDGIGLESTFDTIYSQSEEYRAVIEALSYTGLDIKLTHFQVRGEDRQKLYADTIRICQDYSQNISSINFNYTGTEWRDDGLAKPELEAINEYLEQMPETEKAEIEGDANSDGRFNIADIVAVQLFLHNSGKYRIDGWKKADYDKDGELTVFDLCIMKSILLKDEYDEYF